MKNTFKEQKAYLQYLADRVYNLRKDADETEALYVEEADNLSILCSHTPALRTAEGMKLIENVSLVCTDCGALVSIGPVQRYEVNGVLAVFSDR